VVRPVDRRVVPPVDADVSLDLDAAQIPDVVRALCRVTGHTGFVLSPDVVGLGTKLTISVSGSPAVVWRDALRALALANVTVRCADGLCRFWTIPAPAPAAVPQSVFSYRPRYRDVAFLADGLQRLFSDWHFSASASGSAGSSAGAVSAAVSPSSGSGSGAAAGRASMLEAVSALLVGVGPASERERLESALAVLDRPVPALVVRVGVYEVDTNKGRQSAINVVGNVLGQALTLSGSASSTAAAPLNLVLKVGSFSAVVNALDTSGVAHLVTSPVLRTSSGVIASFAVGDSVPTLGSVSYAQGSSTPVQSVEYQQSGVVFSVIPQVVGQLVDVALYQSVSAFVTTTVGVAASPTLQNRVLSSDLQVRPGETVVLGGLMQTSHSDGSSGWWIFPNLSKNKQMSKTELVLILSVDYAQ
jgi:type II secretory pathway component GspD/PulD (secretin)